MNHDQTLKVIYTELPYWPSVSHLANLSNASLVFLENCEHFVKSSNRNRCLIAGPNGQMLLSIPIAGGRSHKQLYHEVRPDEGKSWRRQHWHSIQTAYGKSPFFEYYAQEVEQLYTQNHGSLWDFNLSLFRWLLHKLGIRLQISLTVIYEPSYPLNDFRQSGAWSGIRIPPYYQNFASKNGFQSDMAGFDLLFHLGPQEGRAYLKKLHDLHQTM